MRIALISEHASPLALLGGVDAGGQNVYVARIARQLARARHEVDVITRRDDPALPDVVEDEPGVRIVHVDAGPARPIPKERLLPHMDAFADGVEALATQRRYDVAHANFFMSGLAAMRLRQRRGVPYAITFHALGAIRRLHQGDSDAFPPEREAIERRLVHDADCLIAECPQDEADLVRHYDADARRIRVVPCGFDPAELGPLDRRAARAQLDAPAEGFVVLQLGRLVPRKGVDNVIRAIAPLVRRHGVDAHLRVVGGASDRPDERATPEIARLRRIAREVGVGERVAFLGRRPRPALSACYNGADAFVTTPWYEPFGITPVEAMACGTPVVGSAVGGIRHTIVDGVTGFLVPPDDPDLLAARLAELAETPALARAMGRAGMRRARDRFTWRRIADELSDVYRSIARTRAPVPRPTRLAAAPATAPASEPVAGTTPVRSAERALG